MKFNYQENANKPGIYKIINTHTNRIYIGQAARFERRWYDHKLHLSKGNHQNKFLLHDFNKCQIALGHTDFLEFHVLEVLDGSTKNERNLREEHWISQHWDKQDLCYNFKQKAEGAERSCRSLNPEDTKKKTSESMKKVWDKKGDAERLEIAKKISESHKGQPKSAAHRENNRLSHLGQPAWNKGLKLPQLSGENHPMFGKHHTDEAKAKNALAHTGKPAWNKGKTGYKTVPCSEEKKMKISLAQKGKVISDECKAKISKSRTGKNAGRNSTSAKIYDNIKLQSPDGRIFTKVDCLTEFSKENNLKFKCLWKLLNHKTPSHYGWKLIP